MATETELKLQCDPASLAVLARHPRLQAAHSSDSLALEAVYFDAPDRRLSRAGVTLRVRRERDRFVQTVKAEKGGLFERSEWEKPVAGPEPSREAAAKTPVGKLLKRKDRLEPVFTVAVDRRIFLVEEGGSRIEVALDQGRIDVEGAGAERRGSVSEVELELKEGSAKDLFVLARELGEAAPLRLGVQSKAERGFALSAPESARAVKAEPVRLDAEMSAAEAFQAICHACLRHMRLNEAILLERRDPEVLHQTRVAVRRLRSAFSLFGDLTDDGASRVLRDELKRLTEPLGRARNLDVFLSSTLPAERKKRPDEGGLLNLEKTLETERAKAYEAVGASLRSDEWRSLILDLAAWIQAGPWLAPSGKAAKMRLAQPARTYALEQLEKRRRQVKKRGKDLDELSPEARHQVRIAAKKLRYGAEFFGALFDGKKEAKRHAAFVGRLKELQEHLGDLNDIATAYDVVHGAKVEGRSGLFAAGLVAADVDGRSATLLAAARAAHEDLLAVRPFWR